MMTAAANTDFSVGLLSLVKVHQCIKHYHVMI